MKKFFVFGAIAGALMILAGCYAAGPPYGPYGGYYQPPQPTRRVEVHPVRETQTVPARVEIISTLVPVTDREIRLGAAPFNPGGSQDPNLHPFTTRTRVYARVQQRGGKWVEGWLPPGTTLFCRFTGERDGYREYLAVEVAKCGNPIVGIIIKEYPSRIETRIETTVREVEPYPSVYQPYLDYLGWGGYGSYSLYYNSNNYRSVNITRPVRLCPTPRPTPTPRPAPRICPPGRPGGR